MADADGRRLNGGRGLGAALAADFDPWAAVGGVRGLVETTVPGIIFLVVYTVTKDVGLSVVAPLGVALGCLAVRLNASTSCPSSAGCWASPPRPCGRGGRGGPPTTSRWG